MVNVKQLLNRIKGTSINAAMIPAAIIVLSSLSVCPLTGTALALPNSLAQQPQSRPNSKEWQLFTSQDGGFSILLTGTPKAFTNGNVLRFITTLQNSSILFDVRYSIVNIILTNPSAPGQSVTKPSAEFFRGYREATIGKGRLIQQQDVQLDGYAGHEFRYQDADSSFHRVRV